MELDERSNPFAKVAQAIIDARAGISPMERTRLNEIERYVRQSTSAEVVALRTMIDSEPSKFAVLMCEAILGINREGVENPFSLKGEAGKPTCELSSAKANAPLAEGILKKLTKVPAFGDDDEFVSLQQLAIKSWVVYPHFFSPHFTASEGHGLVEQFVSNFYEELGRAHQDVCVLLNEGLPLYGESTPAGKFRLVPYREEEYVFLRQRARMEWDTPMSYFPDWTKKYFVKQEDIGAHEIFFRASEGKDETTRILRTAFLRHIGLESRIDEFEDEPARSLEPRLPRAHKTRLLALVDSVIERYYGVNFNPVNSDTWPSQESVVGWLKAEHGLSGREAMSIDIIARPDTIRGK